jgi:hypothetical protein
MTTGFQQQQSQSQGFSLPRTVRQPQQIGRKLDSAPQPPAPPQSEPRSFK